MLNNLTNRVPLAASLPHKLMWYFSSIALMIGLTLYLCIVGLSQWVEDEVNQRELATSAPFAIEQFQQGAKQPLSIGLHVEAYYSEELIPQQFGDLSQFPADFLGEVVDRNQAGFLHEIFNFNSSNDKNQATDSEIFLYRNQFELNGETVPLYLIMPSENVELSQSQWNAINIFVLCFICVLFLLFGFAIHKLSSRLVDPVKQLVKQLKSPSKHSTFSVTPQSAVEFSELANTLNDYRQQNEMMIKQEQAFARYASHELRTPLTVISGAAKLQEQNHSADFQQRQRSRIQRAALDMQHTIDALLNLVKQENATTTTPPRVLQQTEVEQLIQPLLALAHTKQITISLTFHQGPLIKPTPAVLRMLLTNVITNAINASDSGEITIVINSQEIVISDRGRGLSAAEHDNHNGHGLGLLIVDSLCQRYHWQFELSDAQPSGCSARLTFPKLKN